MRKRTPTLTVALLALTATPAAAGAATRYAATGGSGTACTTAAPCSIVTAVSGAGTLPGDEVIVTPGTYALAAALIPSSVGMDIHGQAGQPAPTIASSAVFGLYSPIDGRLADLEILDSNTTGGATVIGGSGSVLERVKLGKDGLGAALRVLDGGLVTARDSTFTGDTEEGILVSGPAATGSVQARFEHITSVARNPSGVGIAVVSSAARTASAVVRDSILSGPTSDASMKQSGASAALTLTRTFVRTGAIATIGSPTITDGGGNSAAVPLFADLAAGDLRQAPGSPTIDALPGPGTGSDFEGDARPLGAGVDAGGDEFRPVPTAATGGASAVGSAGATVTGTADSLGLAGTWRIEYGPTAAYGSTTPPRALAAGAGPVEVAAALAGLPASSDVHYRLVAITSGGTANGADQTVHTAAAPAPGGGGVGGGGTGGTTPPPATPLKVTQVKVRGTTLSYTVSAAGQLRVVVRRGVRTVKTITRSVRKGSGTIRLGRLAKGRYAVSVTATSAPTKAVKVSFKRS